MSSGVASYLTRMSPFKFVLVQLVCQLYLLCLAITCCSVSSHLTSLASDCSLPSLRQAGYSLLVYGLCQLLPALICVLVHVLMGYIARPLFVRLHLMTTCILAAVCIASLVMIIRMVQEANHRMNLHQPVAHCVREVSPWLPALLPLLVIALLFYLLTVLLLTTTNLVSGVKPSTSPPRVRLDSNKAPVLVISNPSLEHVRSQIFTSASDNQGSLSHRSLQPTALGPSSPIMASIPLTPCTEQEPVFFPETVVTESREYHNCHMNDI
jgi:hypothetical protein